METSDLAENQKDRLLFLQHAPNSLKTDDQWAEYLKFYEMLDWEEPDRSEKIGQYTIHFLRKRSIISDKSLLSIELRVRGG